MPSKSICVMSGIGAMPLGFTVEGGGAHHTSSAWAEEEPSVPPPVLVAALSGHLDVVLDVAFSPDGRKVLTGSDDGSARMWEVGIGRELVQLWHLKGGGWMAIVPQGYFEYDGSNETLERVNLQDSSTGRPLTPEELKRYHRPDLVTKTLSGGP